MSPAEVEKHQMRIAASRTRYDLSRQLPAAVVLPPIKLQPKGSGQVVKKPRGMNGLESSFAAQLDLLKIAGKISSWQFEAVRLRIASGAKTAWFKPDFLVQENGELVFYETKGHWREAARLRMKVAAGLYPQFKFVAVQKIKGAFVYEEFSA